MELSKATRMTLVIVAGVVILGLAAITVWSGARLDLGEILSAVSTLAGVLLGIGVAGGRAKGAAPLFLIVALGSSGCASAPCQIEHTVVSALDAGVTVAAEQAPEEESWADALNIAQGAVLLGQAAVDACDLARDGAGWRAWVEMALEAASGLVAHFGAASDGDAPPEPPAELNHAVALLRSEL